MASQADTSSTPTWISALAALALLAPAVVYFALLMSTSINVPYLDDFDTILGYLHDDQAAQTFSERLHLLLAPHVEHRLLVVRGASLLSIRGEAPVDFRLLACWGSLGIVLLTVALYFTFRRGEGPTERILAFVPASFMLFAPQAWDSWFWATSSLSNLWVLPLALLAFIALDRGTAGSFICGVVLGTLAALTQANGLLVLPVGCAILLFRKRPGLALGWVVFSALLGAAYAFDFEVPTGSPGLEAALSSPLAILHYAINFLGSAVGFGNPIASPIAGLLLVVSAFALFFRNAPRNLPMLGLLALIIGSALLNALAREHIRGPDYALDATRYRTYACAALAITYLAWSESIRDLRRNGAFTAIVLALAIGFNTASYALYFGKAVSVQARLEGGLQKWQVSGRGLRHPHPARATRILARAIEEGHYQPPAP